MVKLKIYWLRDQFIICYFFHPRWRRFDLTVHHPFRFARTRPIQQETNPGIQGHDTTISCLWSRSWIDEQRNGFFCMLGLYKRQSRAEARGGAEGEEQRKKTQRRRRLNKKPGTKTQAKPRRRGPKNRATHSTQQQSTQKQNNPQHPTTIKPRNTEHTKHKKIKIKRRKALTSDHGRKTRGSSRR